MSVRRWPDTFPTPSMPGFTLQPVDPSIRTSMEVGAARVRRRTFSRLDRVTMEWRMTPVQYSAFRAWFESLSYSLLGASDDLSIWNFAGAVTRAALVGISPDGLAIDRVLETAVNAVHRVERASANFAINSVNMLVCATIKAQGRSLVRLGMTDRNGTYCYTDADLSAGTLGAQTGLVTRSILDRGNGWYRITAVVPMGVGVTVPAARLQLLDAGGNANYLGDVLKGVDVCETMVRVQTGNDLFVPTETDGTALGASGGSAWFQMPLAVDSGLKTVECRFTGTFKAVAGAGLNRTVTAEVEVRNA